VLPGAVRRRGPCRSAPARLRSACPRAGSSAVERWFYTPDVAGSNPVPPTNFERMRREGPALAGLRLETLDTLIG
jgi:hypothetical protein